MVDRESVFPATRLLCYNQVVSSLWPPTLSTGGAFAVDSPAIEIIPPPVEIHAWENQGKVDNSSDGHEDTGV